MNPKPSKLQQQQIQETVQETASHNAAHEFSSVEEALRRDAAQMDPPPQLAHRVAESIAREPRPGRSWWRRLFSN
jgi:hypothetical protein